MSAMDHQYETLDLIEEVTRKDGSKYYEISNIDQNGIAELAANRGYIKRVQILKVNIARTKPLITYEKYINENYHLQTLLNEDDWKNPKWVEWEKPKGKILDAYKMVLKANRIG
ncbi:hypothetical protein FD39_GL001105 [Lactobacillus amylolyticus DSM 11664]|uniref:Uncharacterized protein n=2 Tax=Lactobacillus amylolyticus TaxID=83683 RepID=D4YTU4_9LACO|nr:hypothetical protein HMPREF0493_0955 [Lactobacillus amylolyticus DSM 11664]KRL17359.1 hypothetical protein FD39_GL001105 [Lactobacillus amylolyticus DSM 11664]